MKGAANVSLTPTKISTVEVPVPPLEVQREFIASLEGIDGDVDEARRRVALLQESKHDALNELRGHFTEGLDADLPDYGVENVENKLSADEDVRQPKLPSP